jgi:DNA polymerase
MERIKEIKEEIINLAKNHELYKTVLKTNGNIVINKGSEKPDFLFIGEAPGFTENKQGLPFVGRSGKILDKWIESRIENYGVINTIPIIPLDKNGRIRPPTKEEIDYFRPLIKKLIKIMNPKYIICVGKSASNFLEENFRLCEWKGNIGFIYHPSYYLRNGKDGVNDFEKLIEKTKNQKSLGEFQPI